MTERELLAEITRISREAILLDEAIERTRLLLAQQIGGGILLVHLSESCRSFVSDKSIADFLDSREFPFRGLYTVSLVAGNRKAGKLVACFGSWGSPGEFLQRVTEHMGKQFEAFLSPRHESLAGSQAAA